MSVATLVDALAQVSSTNPLTFLVELVMPVTIQPLLGFAAFDCQTVLLFLAAWLPATALAQDAGATEATVADSSEEAFELSLIHI